MTTLVKKVATGALAALTLGGATLATATPAAAQHWRGGYGGGWHGGYHRGYGGAGLAVAGLAGLAIGASLADRPYYGGYYGGYYSRPYYGGYYAPGYYYGPGYYRYGYRHDWCYWHPYRC